MNPSAKFQIREASYLVQQNFDGLSIRISYDCTTRFRAERNSTTAHVHGGDTLVATRVARISRLAYIQAPPLIG